MPTFLAIILIVRNLRHHVDKRHTGKGFDTDLENDGKKSASGTAHRAYSVENYASPAVMQAQGSKMTNGMLRLSKMLLRWLRLEDVTKSWLLSLKSL